jgi:hypothetical protein
MQNVYALIVFYIGVFSGVLLRWQLFLLERPQNATVVSVAWTQTMAIHEYQVKSGWTWFKHMVPKDAFNIDTTVGFYSLFTDVDGIEVTMYNVAYWVHVGEYTVQGAGKTVPNGQSKPLDPKVGETWANILTTTYYLNVTVDIDGRSLTIKVDQELFSRASPGDSVLLKVTATGRVGSIELRSNNNLIN